MSRLRRLMANDVAYALVLLMFVAAVVAWVYWPHEHGSTVVQPVLEAPPATPLRDSGPANNVRPKVRQRGSQVNRTGESPSGRRAPSVRPQNRPLPTPRRQTARTKPERRRAPHKPKQPAQGPQSPPPPPPAVGVTVPAPVTVCARPVAGINC